MSRIRDGLGRLGPDGLIARTDRTAAGVDELLSFGAALEEAFDTMTTIPGSTPPVSIDLGAVFDRPPDPSTVDVDPLDPLSTDYRLVEMFFEQLLGSAVQADWSTSDYVGIAESEQLFERLEDRLHGHGLHWD